MRSKMFTKILALPIGYFNEQRKGDIMSRLTNDLGDVETSVINVIGNVFREPDNNTFFFHLHGYIKPAAYTFSCYFFAHIRIDYWQNGRSLKSKVHKCRKSWERYFPLLMKLLEV